MARKYLLGLHDSLAPHGSSMYLTPQQTKLYDALLLGQQSTTALCELIRTTPGSLKAQLCYMRKKGLEIRNVWGRGYLLESDDGVDMGYVTTTELRAMT